ncbi:MAG: signal protein PDZ [Desulfobulbaceae bacterium]|nr:MAG: signal protein PDZ [Desulfobulbaceae bacterium]
MTPRQTTGTLVILILSLLAAGPWPASAAGIVHHDLQIQLVPERSLLIAEDTITLPSDCAATCRFRLHKDLQPTPVTPGITLSKEPAANPESLTTTYRLTGLSPGSAVTIRYQGPISHPLEKYGENYARGFSQTAATIEKQGVYLSGATGWYPLFEAPWLTFDLRVSLPPGWSAVSQGERTGKKQGADPGWRCSRPQEGIYLIAGQFSEYERKGDKVSALVYLRRPDQELADRYLGVTAHYIDLYSQLIGPYPYTKFALVENFWETGFGMPSFTLLGPRVIRFPFILHSSYPHEILHSWWGNSVYPDFGKGNWSEGLTAYLADHLIKEQQGLDANYRQTVLQKYSDYASQGRDFPLRHFTMRHSSASEAVGYGKALMFFHMLRQELGDAVFIAALQNFYARNKFQVATFADLQQSFEKTAERPLEGFFRQWIERPGAPALELVAASSTKGEDGYHLKLRLQQSQAGPPYDLQVPIAVTLQGYDEAYQNVLTMTEKELATEIILPASPARLDVDPQFDLFRRLDRREVPPALSQAFGAREVVCILPATASQQWRKAYATMAASWAQSGSGHPEVILDSELSRLPTDKTIILFGWTNLFREQLAGQLTPYGARLEPDAVHLKAETIQRKNQAIVLTARHPANPDRSLTWIGADRLDAMAGLTRKLPHYHKYSYLAFTGPEPQNISKGRWPVINSPLTAFPADEQPQKQRVNRGTLAPKAPLFPLSNGK